MFQSLIFNRTFTSSIRNMTSSHFFNQLCWFKCFHLRGRLVHRSFRDAVGESQILVGKNEEVADELSFDSKVKFELDCFEIHPQRPTATIWQQRCGRFSCLGAKWVGVFFFRSRRSRTQKRKVQLRTAMGPNPCLSWSLPFGIPGRAPFPPGLINFGEAFG